ncbi:hypothetical protein K438DRAFT_1994634 [Mycena galopus ATCC 62051]|nr:hypothetical protein K438DRAFT_1994634 [Mycena galopus ATCC 62051]
MCVMLYLSCCLALALRPFPLHSPLPASLASSLSLIFPRPTPTLTPNSASFPSAIPTRSPLLPLPLTPTDHHSQPLPTFLFFPLHLVSLADALPSSTKCTFGEVLEGMDVVAAIERQGSAPHGTPKQSVTVAASGIVE